MTDNELKNKLFENAELLKEKAEFPFEISEITEKNEFKRRKFKMMKGFKKCVGGVVGTVAAFTLILNCVPSFAYAISDVPVLGNAVNIVTFGRFEQNRNGSVAKVVTPKIEGLLDKELEKKLNDEFKENASAVINAFQSDIAELEEEYGEGEFHIGVDADYIIRTNNDDILAIDCYILNLAGSSSTKHSFYTIDKKTGELLTLKSLFNDNADYVEPISEYIKKEMIKQNESGSGYFWLDEEIGENFEKIKEDQNFFINENGNIVICFDKYEVAAGAGGCPEFEIPKSVVEGILK